MIHVKLRPGSFPAGAFCFQQVKINTRHTFEYIVSLPLNTKKPLLCYGFKTCQYITIQDNYWDIAGHYSRDGAKDDMKRQLQEMLDNADDDTIRNAIQRCMDAVEG